MKRATNINAGASYSLPGKVIKHDSKGNDNRGPLTGPAADALRQAEAGPQPGERYVPDPNSDAKRVAHLTPTKAGDR